MNRFQNLRVTVMGLGRFGGGLGAVQFLLQRGARVTVTDLQSEEVLADSLRQLPLDQLAGLYLGEHREEDFEDADLVVVNPAVSRENRLLDLARRAGVPLTSEMNLFWQHNPGRVLAVTGSNGKSTTTSLLHAVMSAAGHRTWLGGNIGQSLLPRVEEIQSEDFVILELSSFQLWDLDNLFSSPELGIVTNFSPNHLDWHHCMEMYRYAKQTILRWQGTEQCAVLNLDDPDVRDWRTHGYRCGFGLQEPAFYSQELRDSLNLGLYLSGREAVLIRQGRVITFPLLDWLPLRGRHNVQNALAALAAACFYEVEPAVLERGVQNFRALPHRLEFVGEVNGRKFYNDSKATTPESACMALDAFTEPVVLLAGGYDKKVDLSQFGKRIAERTKAAALMGQTASLLAEHIPIVGPCLYEECENFLQAFLWAVQHSEPGDVILLSPGCASYDWFQNYEERGRMFARLVGSLE